MDDPVASTDGSVGLDLRSDRDIILQPGQIGEIGLGVAIQIPENHAGFMLPRSGNKGFALTNTIGLLDPDYQGQLKARIKNVSNEPLLIYRNDRIIQLCVVPCVSPKAIEFVEEFETATSRGAGGFGSTGDK